MMKFGLSVCLLAACAGGLLGQVAPATPPVAAKPAPDVVAGIPVNYDETKVGTYTLVDPLKFDDGKPVKTAKEWMEKRRPQIEALFESQQFGKAPGRPADETFDVFDEGTKALYGQAIRKQVTIFLDKEKVG